LSAKWHYYFIDLLLLGGNFAENLELEKTEIFLLKFAYPAYPPK
jgi:hypothetical protein